MLGVSGSLAVQSAFIAGAVNQKPADQLHL
jgi:hypothetical protein